jgi:lycopene cyclase domain-containing protein
VPEYTVAAAASVAGVVALESLVLRSGRFGKPAYWISLAIVWFFQILVDGRLTMLTAPVVLYAPDEFLGVRFPWDIPIEDFAFGFSLATLTLLLWETAGRRRARTAANAPPPTPSPRRERGHGG